MSSILTFILNHDSDNILNYKTIDLYNKGNHYRDFTYVDDVTESIIKLLDKGSNKSIPYEIFNIGNGKPSFLKKFLSVIEKKLNLKAKVRNIKFQKGDVYKTHSDTTKLFKTINYKPNNSIEQGVEKFIRWYKSYY